jgi:hypothetical protein
MPRDVKAIPTLLPLDALSQHDRRPPNPERLSNRFSRPWMKHAAWWLHKARQVQIDFERGETDISDETRQGLDIFFSR